MELSTDWELDTPVPSWLQKMMEQHKLLISQTDPSERFKSTKERILDLQTTFSTALNIVHPKNDWTVLEPIAERCLQSLSRNPNNNTIPFAFIEEIDYLDKDVSHILELACYTGISFRLDIYGVKHDIGKDLPYGREFSLCERAGSKIENDTKKFSFHYDLQKLLRSTVSHFKLIKERAKKENFVLGKVVTTKPKGISNIAESTRTTTNPLA
ncbi:3125_t:CDS:2 [Entrophospora sp. SA101]|nr:3125_t:CDS:2 [Entrophospora sp. SA101]